ncbi:MAG: aldehyde dehydrogenase family protein, partial [Acidobacteriota bacterium]|nr:aldehyde dehydrogenase family protein [Acidobacteriota bacterium]
MEVRNILIGGEFLTSDGHLEVASPFDGNLLARVAVAGRSAAEKALFAAEKAAAEMRCEPRYRLREGLEKISQGIAAKKEEFSRSITLESGKPIAQARIEADRAVSTFRIAAAEAQRFAGEIVPIDLNAGAAGRSASTVYVPRGIVFGITPFNYPLNLVAHKVAPALA